MLYTAGAGYVMLSVCIFSYFYVRAFQIFPMLARLLLKYISRKQVDLAQHNTNIHIVFKYLVSRYNFRFCDGLSLTAK